VRYSVYVVTMLGFSKPVWRKSYMLWSDNTTIFTSLLFTDWPMRSAQEIYAGPQVALAYTPLGSEQARSELLDTSDETIQKQTLSDLEKILPGAGKKVEEMRVIRWGHAEPIPYPGYLSRIRPLVAKPMGRVFFAGEATEIPSMEGAIFSAHRAQAELRRFLAQEN
jgi:protoporphyrinogen oxidase